MRKIILYVAMSLDGYLADINGKVDWLNGHDSNGEDMDTYSTFIKDVDTVVMGWNTYHQIVTELSPNVWPYEELESYIITHRTLSSTDNLKFVQDDPCSLVRKQKQGQGKSIWICGGGSVIQPLIRDNLIDEYDISIIPTILGSGIRLFGEFPKEVKLNLERVEAYHGITELVYTRR